MEAEHSIMRSICTRCLVVIALMYPNIVWAQAEQRESASQAPATGALQASGSGAAEEHWWQRFGFGAKAGLSRATFAGEGSSSDYAPRLAGTLGGLVNVRLLSWLAIQPEVLFVSKGPDIEVDGAVTDTFVVHYVEIPLLARVTIPISESARPYLLVGPTLGALLSFKLEDLEDGTIADRTDQAKSMDLGVLGGLGLEYAFSSRHAVVLEGRYNRSLETIARDEAEDLKNSVVTFMVGYQYSLSPGSATPPPPPEPPEDSDLDGIPDQDDDCRREAEDKDGFQDEDGCPDLDNDGDGTPDTQDDCRDDAGPLESQGCPDDDSDGIANEKDDCPSEAGPPSTRGCPDGDDDGIADKLDYCPNTRGTIDLEGCKLVKLSQTRLELLDEVRFRPRDGRIEKISDSLLREVADLLQKRSDLGKLHVTVYVSTKERARPRDVAAAKRKAETGAKEMVSRLTAIDAKLSERLEAKGESEPSTGADEYRLELTFSDDGAEQN